MEAVSAPPRGALTGGEVLRKVVHMAVGLFAFAVAFLGPFWSAVCAAAALTFNLAVLPRIGGEKLWRQEEKARGRATGIVLYPLTVLLLILAFWRHLEVAAAVWGILAFGDGMASVVGMSWGRAKLPWNPRKSWLGSFAYWLFGGAAATVLLWWTLTARGGHVELPFAVVVCGLAALFAACLESQPQGLDDNLGVPLVTGLVLLGLVSSEAAWQGATLRPFIDQVAIGAAINVALAVLAYAARSVAPSGALAGFVVGTTIYACAGWQGYLLLVAFFVLGTGATKLGYRAKAAARLAQERGGRRSARHALANTAVPTLAAVFAATTPHSALYRLAFAGAFATAAGDTASSEIGQLWGRRTFLITTLRPVPRGTEGAVSVEGTLAGVAASLALAALGYAVGFYPAAGIAVVTGAALLGTTLESVAGATLEKRGLLDNEAINFLNTLVGAVAAVALAAAFL